MKLKNLTNEQMGNLLATIDHEGFWYALSVGDYLNPEDILDDIEDIKAVNQAIGILALFENTIENLEENRRDA